MIVVLIGSGTIGTHIRNELGDDVELKCASRSSKEYPLDLENKESIEKFFKKVGKCDHIICVAGKAPLAKFNDITDEQIDTAIAGKMLGQMNIARIGKEYLNSGGSITLTSGYLSHVPAATVAIPAFVNAALERFVLNVSLEVENRFRINVVSPAMLEESMEKYGAGIFSKYPVVSGKEVGEAYCHLLNSDKTGTVTRVGWKIMDDWPRCD